MRDRIYRKPSGAETNPKNCVFDAGDRARGAEQRPVHPQAGHAHPRQGEAGSQKTTCIYYFQNQLINIIKVVKYERISGNYIRVDDIVISNLQNF